MQVDTFGSADPYVCVSALSDVGDHAAVTHNAKAQETHLTKDGTWEMHPQHKTKTIKNELNPVFDEDFVLSHVLTSTVAKNSLQAEELVRQDLTLLLTVHDWNRVGHDMGCRTHRIREIHLIQPNVQCHYTASCTAVYTAIIIWPKH